MTLIKLEELQEYCKYKSIALVGNSSNILRKNKGKEIDAHDIIIRMNHSVNVIDKHYKDIGKRTDIYDCEVSPLHLILKLTGMSNAKYITRLIRWGDTSTKANETIVINSVNKIYLGNPKVHQRLRKSHFNNKVKPSTGAALFNFLIEFTDFKSINLYGFDFFTSSLRNRNNMNEFNSYCYKDHSSQYEQAYFKKFIDGKKIKHIQ